MNRESRLGPPSPADRRRMGIAALAFVAALGVRGGLRADERATRPEAAPGRPPAAISAERGGDIRVGRPASIEPDEGARLPVLDRQAAGRTLQTVALFGAASLAPVALLMLTGFVRISIVLTLLRQALGSPQVPGNQVITALSLLLTALVMWPWGDRVYREAIAPYAEGRIAAADAWDAGARPIKTYMIQQLRLTRHEEYLEALSEYAATGSPGRPEPAQGRAEDFPMRVVAPAYLLSEVTTGLLMGFYLYLPFLVVDLVVSSVLAATGLFMLPPTLVATPIKLILFVLAKGWILVATMLLASFGTAGVGP